MTVYDLLVLLRWAKDKHSGFLSQRPSVINPMMTYRQVWYMLFKACVESHPNAVIPKKLITMAEVEFTGWYSKYSA